MDSRRCFFVSDLHGCVERYQKLFALVEEERPAAVLLGGDLLPSAFTRWADSGDFVDSFLVPGLTAAAGRAGPQTVRFLMILGNDDTRDHEARFLEAEDEDEEVWDYLHMRGVDLLGHRVFGYSCVPPTPFGLKDWERYDVSRYVDPGCVSPEEGTRTVAVDADDVRYGTIANDLRELTDGLDLSSDVVLFHSPPYKTLLDRAELDGIHVDQVPVDVHVGSIAIQRFIDERQPLLTLHGHVHESARLTGAWRQKIGRTHCFSAAHDGEELALVRFDLDDLESATRALY